MFFFSNRHVLDFDFDFFEGLRQPLFVQKMLSEVQYDLPKSPDNIHLEQKSHSVLMHNYGFFLTGMCSTLILRSSVLFHYLTLMSMPAWCVESTFKVRIVAVCSGKVVQN